MFSCDMELETYEQVLAEQILQEQTFYETKPTVHQLASMASMYNESTNQSNFQDFTDQGANIGGKTIKKKKKSVKFLTYVQVSLNKFYFPFCYYHIFCQL